MLTTSALQAAPQSEYVTSCELTRAKVSSVMGAQIPRTREAIVNWQQRVTGLTAQLNTNKNNGSCKVAPENCEHLWTLINDSKVQVVQQQRNLATMSARLNKSDGRNCRQEEKELLHKRRTNAHKKFSTSYEPLGWIDQSDVWLPSTMEKSWTTTFRPTYDTPWAFKATIWINASNNTPTWWHDTLWWRVAWSYSNKIFTIASNLNMKIDSQGYAIWSEDQQFITKLKGFWLSLTNNPYNGTIQFNGTQVIQAWDLNFKVGWSITYLTDQGQYTWMLTFTYVPKKRK